MAFNAILSTTQTTKAWSSFDENRSSKAKTLQTLFDRQLTEQYSQEKSQMEASGAKFRLTKGKVYEIKDENETVDTRVMFQVKGGTMTWYFTAPHDVTHQEFRDEVFQSAGLGHMTVPGHCEKYWRGTNSLHVKKMHTSEKESGMNHNHYRMDDRNADPQAVLLHLTGFVEAQNELAKNGLIDKPNKFLDKAEAQHIAQKFERFWYDANHSGPAKTIELSTGEVLNLPRREKSKAAIYAEHPSQKFTPEDEKEWAENKAKEAPCTSISNWNAMSFEERLVATEQAMRGMGSEFAQTRQIEGSAFATVKTVVPMDDKVKQVTPPRVYLTDSGQMEDSKGVLDNLFG